MRIKILFHYGFKGNLKYKDLFKDSVISHNNVDVLLNKLIQDGLIIKNATSEGFDFILGVFLREQSLDNNSIEKVDLSDYMFLLSQNMIKKEVDQMFNNVNKTLDSYQCYTFKEQVYGFLTLSYIE